MGAAMDMLRKRAMQRPTPFTSERIAFLDPIFGNLWCQEYKRDFKGKEKTFLFGEGYINMYNGLTPTFCPTHQKWVTDVDTLYIAHNTNDVHWVGVVVDLVNRNVKVYDSILSGYQDNVVAESCRPYTKMIPKLLKAAAPPEKRKGMTEAAFQFYRKKSNIPQHIQSGDCGVYTVKFLECLALGHTMDGICDATVPAIRLKLAADILEEAPFVDLAIQVSDPNPRTNPDDKVPLQTDSG
ncbi:hypothetical protein AALP_AAs62162U000100 [Arabis alpina]|uniref:Ubiquitin-like protease family profile domain-containing protein n=1 Tax=Arabis alpina TaxID=50452 RepID=A0A087FY26_ARAAL|nr:hypothetical protein AALP_AAs62162U000100 [Arabis alpina]